jgi:hypothetical protein
LFRKITRSDPSASGKGQSGSDLPRDKPPAPGRDQNRPKGDNARSVSNRASFHVSHRGFPLLAKNIPNS